MGGACVKQNRLDVWGKNRRGVEKARGRSVLGEANPGHIRTVAPHNDVTEGAQEPQEGHFGSEYDALHRGFVTTYRPKTVGKTQANSRIVHVRSL